tara:strand:+ start:2365 stop:3195 length:831 start_codon:yes stop_codon:yes gene_type:complete
MGIIGSAFVGYNRVYGAGEDRLGINPGSLSSLQIWFDPVQNTVTTNGSDQVLSISNEGALGGGFSFYPGTATFDPAEKVNFVGGTGDTMFYAFTGNGNDSMYTVYKDISSIEPKTVISIAKKVNTGPDTPYALWEISRNSNTLSGVIHPPSRAALTVNGSVASIGANPDTSLGSYSYGESDYTFFAWSAEDYYAYPSNGMVMQTNSSNNVNASLVSTPTSAAYTNVVINVAEDLDPGAFSSGRNEHVALMVFDEVLTPSTIAGIYKYYEERGYSMK